MRRNREGTGCKSAKPPAFHKYNKESFRSVGTVNPFQPHMMARALREQHNGQAAVRARVLSMSQIQEFIQCISNSKA